MFLELLTGLKDREPEAVVMEETATQVMSSSCQSGLFSKFFSSGRSVPRASGPSVGWNKEVAEVLAMPTRNTNAFKFWKEHYLKNAKSLAIEHLSIPASSAPVEIF